MPSTRSSKRRVRPDDLDSPRSRNIQRKPKNRRHQKGNKSKEPPGRRVKTCLSDATLGFSADALGVQGRKLSVTGNNNCSQVWAGPLTGKRAVVILWNRCSESVEITANWETIGLHASTTFSVRDLWKKLCRRTLETPPQSVMPCWFLPRQRSTPFVLSSTQHCHLLHPGEEEHYFPRCFFLHCYLRNSSRTSSSAALLLRCAPLHKLSPAPASHCTTEVFFLLCFLELTRATPRRRPAHNSSWRHSCGLLRATLPGAAAAEFLPRATPNALPAGLPRAVTAAP
ncbi:hypothetical protein KSP40_PGU001556 [Platanthera guangdongensis]|uniref:alpha-galactosidase n=1 Tax=Platanthera guangdongensis TaxID=2320717 RepID=A0ABR2LZA1_9ASPA